MMTEMMNEGLEGGRSRRNMRKGKLLSCICRSTVEKVFDRIQRENIRWALKGQKVPNKLKNKVMALNMNAKSN